MPTTQRYISVSVMTGVADVPCHLTISQIDRIDPLYFAHSSRINLKEETRINTTSDEAEAWRQQNANPNGNSHSSLEGSVFPSHHLKTSLSLTSAGPRPNFISDIFFLTLTLSHYGYLKTVSNFEELARQYDDLQRHREMLEGDGSWRGVRGNYVVIVWLI